MDNAGDGHALNHVLRHSARRRAQMHVNVQKRCLLCPSVVDDPVQVGKDFPGAHLYVII